MNNHDDKKKKRQEKIKKMVQELKENANGLSEEDLASLESLISSLTDMDDVPKSKRFIMFVVEFLKSFAISYITSLLAIGFFVGNIAFSSRFYAFLIPLPVAFTLAIFEVMPLPNLFNNHLFDYILVFSVLILIYFILNSYIFTVFDNSFIWIWYLMIAETFSILVHLWFVKLSFGKGRM